MAFVEAGIVSLAHSLRGGVCARVEAAASPSSPSVTPAVARRVSFRRELPRMCVDQLVSKPQRPTRPSENSKEIKDFSGYTNIRPDPVKAQEEADADEGDNDGTVDDGDPNLTYYTECTRCKALFELRPKALGGDGRRVQCCVCKNQWFQKPDRLMTLKEQEELADYPVERAQRFKEGGNRLRNVPNFTAFVGNLSFRTTKEEVEEIFKPLEATRIHLVEKDGKSKGFAFVDFPSKAALDRAVQSLDGTQLSGRQLTVKEGRNSL